MADPFPDLAARFQCALVEYERTLADVGRADGPADDELLQLRRDYLDAEAAAAQCAPPIEAIEAVASIPAVLDWMRTRNAARLVARVSNVGPTEMWADGLEFHPGAVLELEDCDGTTIETPLLFSPSVLAAARAALHQGTPVEALGTLGVVARGKKSVPLFIVHRLRMLKSTLAAVGATTAEIEEVESLIRQHRNDMLPWLVQQLREINGVVSYGLPPQFELAEQAAALQAVSTGQVRNANPRLHVLVVGLPAAGKKLVAAIVKLLQPVALLGQAATLTRAGLAAGALRRKDALVAHAGLLPRAHLGAVVVEDLHGLRPAHRDQVFAILAQAMEDGRFDLSNAASQHFVTETAIYFDLNRRSQLKADSRLLEGGPRAMLADIGMPLHILTRIDVVIELSGTAEDAQRCATAMLGREKPANEVSPRSLQVMMAVLRDRHPEVALSDVKDRATESLQQLLAPLAVCQTRDFDPAAFHRRMANSMMKLVGASARLHDRNVANEDDVALAVELLEPKIDFIRRVAAGVLDIGDHRDRQAAIRRLFGGQVITPRLLMESLGIKQRTAMRDLGEIGEKRGHGQYRIPIDSAEVATGHFNPPKQTRALDSEGTGDGGSSPVIERAAHPQRQREELPPEQISTRTADDVDAKAPDLNLSSESRPRSPLSRWISSGSSTTTHSSPGSRQTRPPP